MAHKDIRKPFSPTHPVTGETRCFEAVGYLEDGEPPIHGNEMLQRVPDAIGEEDVKFLKECRDQPWSEALWPYILATSRRYPGYQRSVSCFYRCGGQSINWWGNGWRGLCNCWGNNVIVVRRIA